jgi:ATP-dependent RNA helicase DeaD
MGKKDRIHPRDIVDLIAESTGLTAGKVGDIALYDKFSFVEVPSEFAEEIVSNLGRASINGRPVSFNVATPVQEGDAKQEGGRPGGFGGANENRPARRGPGGFGGGERREGGSSYGGNRGGSSYGDRREGGSSYGGGARGGSSFGGNRGGSSYGGGYKGNRDGGGSSYGGGYKGRRDGDGGNAGNTGGGYKPRSTNDFDE